MTRSASETIEERTARLFLAAVRIDFEGVEAALERAERALEAGVGGFIVFGGAEPEVARLTERLRGEAERPLWIAADLERGAGQQFAGAATLPPPAGLAAHPEPEAAVRRAAEITARQARAVGVNWVLAPVLDLDVEPRNPIVGTRAFGSDPETVARLGRAWIEACQAVGVAACAKHFPGHGRTTEDSHLAFPVVRADREALEDDLLPFRVAAEVVAGVMTAHVGYEALGAEGPATVEPRVLRELLREEMGFEGLVITDALVMEGFGAGGGTATEGWQAVRALRAGCDLLLYPSDLEQSVRTVRQAASRDDDLAAAVVAALERSDAALRRFAPADAPSEYKSPAAEAAALELARDSLRSTGRRPPEVLDRSRPLRLYALSDDGGALAGGRFGATLASTLGERGWAVERAGLAGEEEGRAARADQALVALEATPRAWKGRADLSEATRAAVRAALDASKDAYLIVFGHPRILASLDRDGACAWSSEPLLERAAALWLDERVR